MLKDKDLDALINQATMVLTNNDIGDSTQPSPHLYPHQWNWDSAFIAIGLSHANHNRATAEIKSMLRSQWSTGMIPHIVFNPKAENYHPGPDYWNTALPSAPKHAKTSGITQPPVLAHAALCVFMNFTNRDSGLIFLQEVYPSLILEQKFFRAERDPLDEGLTFICHPWESGMDNSPVWDQPLADFEMAFTPRFMRKDNASIPSEQRPTDHEYARYSYLVQRYGQLNWDQGKINDIDLFKVQSVLFNVWYLKSLQALHEISTLIGESTAPIESDIQHTLDGFEAKLWNPRREMYLDYDLKRDTPIDTDNISQFLPLFAGIPDQERANLMISKLQTGDYWPEAGFGICTQARSRMEYDAECYWRGPVWINMNWMIIKGLERYNRPDLARLLAHETLAMVDQHGFFEYFNPDTGEGLGSDNFSWTAALVLDLIASGYR